MGLQGYVGSAQDITRIRRQQKKREEQLRKLEEIKKETEAKVESAGLRRFGAGTSDVLETAFKNETVGLVTREEFIQKQNTLNERLEESSNRRKRADGSVDLNTKEKKKQKKNNTIKKPTLSFAGEEEDEGEEMDTLKEMNKEQKENKKISRYGKCPNVVTDFLPDVDREKEEEELREKLKEEWHKKQEKIKSEFFNIYYSYWDGSGHRREVRIKKGATIREFLRIARDQLVKDFRELRAVSIENLMFVKEDVIIPHNYTFYDLIISKARGKSGPLFQFDVHEDIRLENDSRIEKNESHAGKIVERHWYDKNKHIFPASRWEVYDPDKTYDEYTIYG